MPRYKTISNIEQIKSNEKEKISYAELPSKAVKVILLDGRRATAAKCVGVYEGRRQALERTMKARAKAEIRRKTIKMEQAYKKICESESKDLELITAGLARFK